MGLRYRDILDQSILLKIRDTRLPWSGRHANPTQSVFRSVRQAALRTVASHSPAM